MTLRVTFKKITGSRQMICVSYVKILRVTFEHVEVMFNTNRKKIKSLTLEPSGNDRFLVINVARCMASGELRFRNPTLEELKFLYVFMKAKTLLHPLLQVTTFLELCCRYSLPALTVYYILTTLIISSKNCLLKDKEGNILMVMVGSEVPTNLLGTTSGISSRDQVNLVSVYQDEVNYLALWGSTGYYIPCETKFVPFLCVK
ncbi:hypothetical protein ACFE04_013829 [Oxalis oulophora]